MLSFGMENWVMGERNGTHIATKDSRRCKRNSELSCNDWIQHSSEVAEAILWYSDSVLEQDATYYFLCHQETRLGLR
jgi:hypothetical protein